jgi:hypothetical protein
VTRYIFKIGDAFPADDAVARFVTVMAMISNDWHRSMREMGASLKDDADGQGIRMLHARQQFAAYHEAAKFITEARSHYHPEISDFVDGLDAPTRAHYATAIALFDKIPQWLKDYRDVTFHYPKMVRERYVAGKEEIANALEAAAEHQGTITVGDTKSTVRLGFADEVAVQLRDLFDNRDTIKELSEARIALGEFAYAAVMQQLASCGAGVVRTED